MMPLSLNVNRLHSMNTSTNLFDRRSFLNRFGLGLGGIALNEMLTKESHGAAAAVDRGVLGSTHHFAKAKRIIYLFMSGGDRKSVV